MAQIPTYEQMAKNVAEKALDEFLYAGKSIREWIKIITEREPCGVFDEYGNYNEELAAENDDLRDQLAMRDRFKQKQSKIIEELENMPCITPEEMQKCKDIVKKYTPKQKLCDDAISRQNIIDTYKSCADMLSDEELEGANLVMEWVYKAPPVRPKEQTGHCKECKYFEYDSLAKVDGVPLIVAHEICNKWGDGCKTKEDGYCFLFEPQERSDKE